MDTDPFISPASNQVRNQDEKGAGKKMRKVLKLKATFEELFKKNNPKPPKKAVETNGSKRSSLKLKWLPMISKPTNKEPQPKEQRAEEKKLEEDNNNNNSTVEAGHRSRTNSLELSPQIKELKSFFENKSTKESPLAAKKYEKRRISVSPDAFNPFSRYFKTTAVPSRKKKPKKVNKKKLESTRSALFINEDELETAFDELVEGKCKDVSIDDIEELFSDVCLSGNEEVLFEKIWSNSRDH